MVKKFMSETTGSNQESMVASTGWNKSQGRISEHVLSNKRTETTFLRTEMSKAKCQCIGDSILLAIRYNQ